MERSGLAGAWNRRPSSRSCSSDGSLGAPVSGSTPEDVFGNAITSRMLSRPVRNITTRSRPKANPACGGTP